jgi:hypothetical protein
MSSDIFLSRKRRPDNIIVLAEYFSNKYLIFYSEEHFIPLFLFLETSEFILLKLEYVTFACK